MSLDAGQLIDIYQLQQHIDKPSRITNCSQTLLGTY